jgi:hypothetical protein
MYQGKGERRHVGWVRPDQTLIEDDCFVSGSQGFVVTAACGEPPAEPVAEAGAFKVADDVGGALPQNPGADCGGTGIEVDV